MRWVVVLAGLLAVTGCGKQLSPEEQAAQAAQEEREIAMVEEANRGPLVPIDPQPILYPDIEENELYGVSCAFAPDGGGLGAIMLAMMEDGYMKLDGKLERFAADNGSAELPYGTREKYSGTTYAIELAIAEGEGQQVAAESVNYDGQLTVRDANGRVVYDKAGEVQCGS